MTQKVTEYALFLDKCGITKELLQQTSGILDAVSEIRLEFESPAVSIEKKHIVIDRVFPEKIRNFLKLLTDNGDFALYDDILAAFDENSQKPKEAGKRAVLSYVEKPTEDQLARIRDFLEKEFHVSGIEIILRENPDLKSGFQLKYGAREYDWSESGRLAQLKERLVKTVFQESGKDFSEEGIISILQSSVEDFELEAQDREVGVVTWVGDGIANVDGIDHAGYGEVVIFDCGINGMVQDVRRNEIGVILFGSDTELHEGSRVVRTGRMAGIPVGKDFLGRVVNALGDPIDGKGEIETEGFRSMEFPAPSIVDRKSVSVPMETGILAIDSMFPIGRGQRELIIGDRQTGKTSIALDAILNQKGKDVICIYAAIGQKASTVAQLVNTLKKHDALSYTTVVCSTASDPSPLQYVAPYSATALAEYFMYRGKDVLIVYDDLSKHAVAYRAISLLLERSPGREAYPGDVFYLHSRLLERSARLSPEAGGGSITALPIIETQAGDVSAYIPTNVISITDGQIYLESELFNAGQRPAVNVGLSVSRVGGAAQSKAMKKAAGSVRIDLAQYREMEVFTQFSSDLDEGTKKQLAHGKALMELLKQPLGASLSMPEQVVLLVCVGGGIFDQIPVEKIGDYKNALITYYRDSRNDILKEIENGGVLTDEIKSEILLAAGEFAKEADDTGSEDGTLEQQEETKEADADAIEQQASE
ncbi:MAG: F0F1 ATP synthase subunit alpha [Lachnospiraceae bacterium]|nr:F0F1 ATP synthase subunit alpha [Lachnospiraceae bacterium]